MGKKLIKSLLFIGIGLSALYLVFYFQQKSYNAECLSKSIPMDQCSLLDKLISDFSQANFLYLFITMSLFMISNYVRALRWNMLLEPLKVKPSIVNSLGAIMVAYLVNLTVPRAGEIARATVLSKYEDIDFEKAFGTIITDRLIDGVCLLIMGTITFVFAFDKIFGYFEQHLNLNEKLAKLYSSLPLLGLLLIILIISIYLLVKFKSILLNSKIGEKVFNFVLGLKEGVFSVLQLKNPILFIVYSIIIWSMYFLMAFSMFKAFQPTEHLDLTAALVVFFFGSLGIVFPSPGGMGSYHFLAVESLSLYGINSFDAFSYANMNFFTVQIFTIIFFGVLSLILLPIFNKSKI